MAAGRGNVAGSTAVPDRVLASWRRSHDYGVSPETVEPAFSGTLDHESLFFECGAAVLAGLHSTLIDEPISLMLTDSAGLVLNRLCGDARLLAALDGVYLAPGFAFSEREAGTSGLGLALADRLPALVRADEHYSAGLTAYTCAAVPVLDPVSGRLEGSVNVTTWAPASGSLLLALAQSAAGNTAALMLARARGRTARPVPRGEVVSRSALGLEPGAGSVQALSTAWTDAVAEAEAALRAGRVVAAVGERGSGRATLLAQAQRRARPRERILCASPPGPRDIEAWLSLWTPELGKAGTAVVVCEVDTLPIGAAEHLREALDAARAALAGAVGPAGGGLGGAGGAPHPDRDLPFMVTAERLAEVPAPLATTVDTVVRVPPLRERTGDVLVLAHHIAQQARSREVGFTPAAQHALQAHSWPGNVDQLDGVVRRAAMLTDTIDVRHLPPEVFSGSSHRLSRLESLERAEIVRCLTRPGATVVQAAAELGMSRATIYRKLAQYDLHIPRRPAG